MLGALYINKVHAEDAAEEEEENEPSEIIDTNRALGVHDIEHLFEDEEIKRLRYLPEYSRFRFVLFPDDRGKEFWDTLMLCLMAFTVTVTPYRVAFVDNDSWGWIIADLTIDCLFFLDVLVNSFSAYYDATETLVVEKRHIFFHYLRTWFFVDLLSCIPFSFIFSDQSNYGSLMRVSKLPRLYRILKFAKITRMLKAYKNRGKCAEFLAFFGKIQAGLQRLMYFFLVALVVIHFIACMWRMMDKLNYPDVDTWLQRYNMGDASDFDIYIASTYWTITTLATVGYGDIVAANTTERIFSSSVILIGMVFYSYTIGMVTGLLGDYDKRNLKLSARLSVLQDISRQYGISRSFMKRLKAALETDQFEVRKEREDILRSLPRKLAAKLTVLMHKQLLENNIFFKERSLKFVQSVLPLLRPAKYHAEEVIYRSGEIYEEMYFIGRGSIAFFIDELHVHVIYETIVEGDYFGEIEFFFAEQRETNVKSLNISELLALTRNDLFNTVFPEFEDLKIEMIIAASQRKDRLKTLREGVEQQRREQYRKAKGLPITLTHNEINRLKSMQPRLQDEIIFEEEERQQQQVSEVRRRRQSIAERKEGIQPELRMTLNTGTLAILDHNKEPESITDSVRLLETRVGRIEEAIGKLMHRKGKWAVEIHSATPDR